METIQNLLNDVNDKIKALDTAKQLYSQQLAPEFRVFDFINTGENGLSWILANLLDPNGTHAQKDLFLRQFIDICLPNLSKNAIWQPYTPYLAQTSVVTEQTTTASNTQRRMDIYLSLGDKTKFGICIENKPYASDQQNQMFDYEIEMRKRHQDNFHLVYLSENGEPTDWSVPAKTLEAWKASNLISFVTYTQLVEWLTSCKTACQNQSVIEFINQFIKFIQKQFMGVEDMNEQAEILKIIQLNSQNISSAISISSSIDKMKENLMNNFIEQLRLKSKNKPYHVETNGISPKNKCQNIQFKVDGLSDFDIRIQFEDTNYSTFFIGVATLNENLVNSEKYLKIARAIKSREHELQKNVILEGNIWCIWYDLEPTHWNNNPEVWAEIPNGNLSDNIIKQVEKLIEILKTVV